MTHLYKIQLQLADLFISKITDTHIHYEIRDKETGKLIEPAKVSPYTVHEGKIHFDMRFITVELAARIVELLN